MKSNPAVEKILLKLLHQKVVPAIGCTEPIAVSLAVAKSREILGEVPASVEIYLSKNVLKNGMCVGIPSTGKTGLYIAAALGVVTGNSEDKLKLLQNITKQDVAAAEAVIHTIKLSKKDTNETLYIEVISKSAHSYSKVIIAGTHTNFVLLEKDNEVFLSSSEVDDSWNNTIQNSSGDTSSKPEFYLQDIYDFAVDYSISDLEFILESANANKRAAEIGLAGTYGLGVSKNINKNITKGIFSDDILSYTLQLTTAAIDARMSGENVIIYSNSGSGDQGITVTLPVLAYYEKAQIASQDKLIRALTLSHLVAIYIKLKLGLLSPFCGVTTASMGAACGITFLMGGSYKNISYAIKNCAAGITGMICDGAKNGCSLKVASAVFSAINAATMAIDNIYPADTEGIIHSSIETTIDNISNIGKYGMQEVDNLVLEIMLNK